VPVYWMISNRALQNGGFTLDRGPLTYWVSDKGPLSDFKNWQQLPSDVAPLQRSGDHLRTDS